MRRYFNFNPSAWDDGHKWSSQLQNTHGITIFVFVIMWFDFGPWPTTLLIGVLLVLQQRLTPRLPLDD